MKYKLTLESGVSARGAQMGRGDRLVSPKNTVTKFHLTKLQWVNRDYDQVGAYWGNNGRTNIYCAEDNLGNRLFIRQPNRLAAKEQIIKQCFPNAKFYR